MTFLANPIIMRFIPPTARSSEAFLFFICGIKSFQSTIGPEMIFGKNVRNKKQSNTPPGLAFPRYISVKYETAEKE